MFSGETRQFLGALCAITLVVCGPEQAEARTGLEGASSSDLVLTAIALVGVPYRSGGNDPATGLDCSGLVHFAARNVLGLQLPRQSEAMSRIGSAVARQALQPGDLVFFNTLGRAYSHVGMYVGNDQFVHAPARRGYVRIESMAQSYWARRYNGARRLDSLAGDAGSAAAGDTKARLPIESDDPYGLSKP